VIAAFLAGAAFLTSLTGFVTALRVNRGVKAVRSDVRTSNGQTIGDLLESAEGRRVRLEVEPEERTEAEQHYVSRLEGTEESAK
jgi:hypothetical protein